MKTLITGVVLVMSLLFIASCAGSTPLTIPASPEPSPASQATIAVPRPLSPPIVGAPGMTPPLPPARNNVYSVQSKITSSKQVYMPGEQIKMELTLTNASTGDVEPVYVSPLPPGIKLVTSGLTSNLALPPNVDPLEGMTAGAPVKTFPAGTGEAKLAVGENITYELTWDQKTDGGIQAPSGWYFYETEFSIRRESSTKIDSTSGSRTKAFLIQYPQGAMQKTIDLNLTQTLTGLPFTTENETRSINLVLTLNQVVLDEKGASFYAVVTSPGATFSRKDQPQWAVGANMARFIVDGVMNNARAANMQVSDSKIELRWGAWGNDPNFLDPVPADARSLTFVINRLFEWEGPWEFEIPLD